MNETRIILTGAYGRMGRAVCALVADDPRARIVCGIDVSSGPELSFPVFNSIADVNCEADVIVDFSHHSAIYDILEYAKEKNIPAVIATTGHDEDEYAFMQEAAKSIPVFYSRNMSIGINLMIALSKKAAAILGDSFDIEIVEEHHSKKLDAPSGTALMIADAVRDTLEDDITYTYDRHLQRRQRSKSEIGIHSVRGGSIVGEHEIIFAGQDEVLRIHHSAFSREVFSKGALSAALYLTDCTAGMYSMEDMLG